MSLEELTDAIEQSRTDLGEAWTLTLDQETRNELALLEAALEPESTDELLRRAIHLLFQSTVETGTMDFHLRSGFDVTYDEYLMGVTMDTYNEDITPEPTDDRRYRF